MKLPMRILGRAFILWAFLLAISPAVSAQSRDESALWEGVKDSKDPEDYRAYLDKYPDGVYAPIAKRRIASLMVPPAASPQNSPTVHADSGSASGPNASKHNAGDVPITMTECEGVNNCATWTFLGKQGNGQWPSGEIASLGVETLDGDSIVIHRTDSSGPSAGLTATYRGTRHGDRIGGEFTSSWPDHWVNKSGNWYGTLEKSAQAPPPVMHTCNVNGCTSGKGGTLVLENGHYRNLTTSTGTSDVWAIVSFSTDSVVLRRTLSGAYNGTATFSGHISARGNTIDDGVLKWDSGGEGRFRAAWGAAIDTIPGSNPELERHYISVMPIGPVVCFPWFFGIVCN
jgi:hypothetical protein